MRPATGTLARTRGTFSNAVGQNHTATQQRSHASAKMVELQRGIARAALGADSYRVWPRWPSRTSTPPELWHGSSVGARNSRIRPRSGLESALRSDTSHRLLCCDDAISLFLPCHGPRSGDGLLLMGRVRGTTVRTALWALISRSGSSHSI